MEMMTRDYTIERLRDPADFTPDIRKFLIEEVPKLAALFGDVFDWKNTSPFQMAKESFLLVVRRKGEVRGFLVAFLGTTDLDPKIIILRQMTFYVKPGSGRAAYYLFQKFIDIGKVEANHIITMLTSQTNIKPSTIEKMGFKELETLYRLEV